MRLAQRPTHPAIYVLLLCLGLCTGWFTAALVAVLAQELR